MDIKYQLYGAKELDANLKTLPLRVQKKVIKTGLQKAQRVLRSQARARARSLPNKWPKDNVDMSSLLAKHIIVDTPKMKNQFPGCFSVYVRLRPGFN